MKYTSKHQSVLSGSIISIATSLIVGGLGYATRIVLSNKLSLTDYGFIFGAISFFSIFIAVFDMGVGQSGLIFMSQARDSHRFQTVFSTFTICRLVLAGISLVLFIPLSSYLALEYFKFESGVDSLIILSGWMAFTITTGTFLITFDALRDYKIRNFIQSLMAMVTFTTVFLTVKYGLNYVAISFFLGPFIACLVGWWYVTKKCNLSIRTNYLKLKKSLTEMFHFTKWVAVSTAGFTIMFNMDSLMIVKMKGLEAAGLYNIAIPIFQIPLTLLAFAPKVFIPKLAYECGRLTRVELCKKVFFYQTVIFVPCLIGLAAGFFLIDDIICILFQSEYLPAKNAAFILCCGVPFYGMALISSGVLQALRCEKQTALVVIVAVVLNFICNYIFIPTWEIEGAAMATCLTYIFLFVTFQIFLIRFKCNQLSIDPCLASYRDPSD